MKEIIGVGLVNNLRRLKVVKSLSIYNVNKFEFVESVSLPDSSGSIAPVGKSLTINRDTVLPFTCTYNIIINEDILAKDMKNGTYIPTESYKKSNTFSGFFDETRNLLLLMAPAAVSKNFIKELENNYPNKIDKLSTYTFDFHNIHSFERGARGIYFNVDDDTDIDTKHFFGNGVQENVEVQDAIDNDKATYLMAKIDVDNKERTIGFSRKGTLVIYSKPNDDSDQGYLQLALDTLLALSQQ
ncbi:hypothetical protein FD17_GL001240 [Lentilactobacillus sunkii DSM 19904]|uniref:Uncharacterized protein n=1 Tax=Lentilactobacillus sunkii DSM 19904 TaxID=1423808 RepID=A0A0R1KV57_9LACO|nr:hypothetical protein FD17_GL001240 [Lentilactobacillus sunkii DSM 19904]